MLALTTGLLEAPLVVASPPKLPVMPTLLRLLIRPKFYLAGRAPTSVGHFIALLGSKFVSTYNNFSAEVPDIDEGESISAEDLDSCGSLGLSQLMGEN